MMIGYRGWMGHDGSMTDSAGVFTEPILNAWGISYHMVETDDDVGRISDAFEEAEQHADACGMSAGRRVRVMSGSRV